MSKNMTRKGLALGSALALTASAFVSAPAYAGVVDDAKVSLLPSAGSTYSTHQFGYFDLKSNFAQSLEESGTNLKFLVEGDTLSNVEFDLDVNGATADANTPVGISSWTKTAIGATTGYDIVVTTSSSHFFQDGDSVTVAGLTDTDGTVDTTFLGLVNATHTIDALSATTFGFSVTTSAVTVTNGVSSATATPTLTDGIQSRASILAKAAGSKNIIGDLAAGFVDSRPTDGSMVISGGDSNASDTTLRLVSNSTETLSVGVTAWHDTNGNDEIDATETQSTKRTIRFVKGAAVYASLSQVVLGAPRFIATVTASDDINVAMLVGDVTVSFDKDGTAITTRSDENDGIPTTGYSRKNATAVSYSVSLGALRALFEPDGDATDNTAYTAYSAAAGTYGVRANLWDGSTFTASAARTSAATATATADVVEIAAVKVDGSVKTTKTTFESNTTPDAADYAASTAAGVATVKKGTLAVTVEVFVGDNTIAASPLSSVPVTLTALATGANDSVGITAADGVTINGSTFPGSANKAFVANTGTNGKAVFNIVTKTGDDADNIQFTYNVQNVTGGAPANQEFNVTWANAAYTAYDVADTAGGNARSLTAGGSITINYLVADQWGKAPTDNTYRVVAQFANNAGRSKAADAASSAAVVAGRAAVTLVDNGTGTGTVDIVADSVLAAAAYGSAEVTTNVKVVADAAAATVTMDALKTTSYGADQYTDADGDGDATESGDKDNRTKLVLSTKTFANYDGRIYQHVAAPEATAATAVTLTGTVKNAAGTGVAGAPVTLAAKGFQFKTGSVWAADSISLLTASDGTFSVQVWSQVGGEQTITITSGAASTTQKLTYAAGTATAASFEIAAVATSLPGKTVDVKVSVKDKFGNPAQGVAVALRSTGPGYLLQTSITTDRLGEAFTKLLVGASESGSAVVTATMTIAGVETSKAVTVVVGAPEPVAKIGSFNGRVAVRVENAKGSTISVKIGRTWYKYNALNDNYLQSWRSAKGRSVAVSVYVDGELQNVQTITVK